jgi:hypothetical protein
MTEHDISALSIGAMIGGTGQPERYWEKLLTDLMEDVAQARGGIVSPLCVNVVYQVPGNVLTELKFEGVRTGRYSAKDHHLLIQAALPRDIPDDPDELIGDLLLSAVDAAVQFGRKRKLADDLPEVRAIARTALGRRGSRGA